MSVNLNELELDALREIVSVGAGHASTALSKMTDMMIEVSFPDVHLYPLEEIPYALKKSDGEVTSIFLHIDGKDRNGQFEIFNILLLFPRNSAFTLTSLLQGISEYRDDFTDMDISTLKEVGNMLTGSCFTAMSEYIDFEMVESLPDISSDMLYSVIDPIIANHASEVDSALVLDTELMVNEQKIKCNFIVLFYSRIRGILKKQSIFEDIENA